MVVKFYKFDKRINSTKQPTGTAPFQPDCKLKQNCSEHEPVLLVTTNDFGYSYAYIDDWGKYYFVRDVVSINSNLVEYHLIEDVMATAKADIGNTYAHILYSSSDYDASIIDSRIQLQNSWQKDLSYDTGVAPDYTERAVFDGNGGGYILTVFNSATAHSSGISTSYLLNESGLGLVKLWLTSTSATTYFNNYFNGNVLNGVFGIIHVPYKIPSGLLTQMGSINIGNRNQGDDNIRDFNPGECYGISGFPKTYLQFKLPCHLRYTDFRAYEPYTTGNLYLPGVGIVDLKMSDWKGSSYINIVMVIEVITGNIKYMLGTDNGILIQTFEANVAAQCPLGQFTTNSTGMMAGIGGTIGGLVTLAAAVATEGSSLAIMAGAGAAVAGVANTVLSANQHAMSVTGNYGSRIHEYDPYIYHTEFSVDTEDPDDLTYIAIKGRPCNGTRKISDLSGFVQCYGASISSAMNMTEKEEVNMYLNSGFYYE